MVTKSYFTFIAFVQNAHLFTFINIITLEALKYAPKGICDILLLVKDNTSASAIYVREPLPLGKDLGCAFHQNSAGFQRKWDKSHRPARNNPGTSTGMCYNTILDIPVHSGWYLLTRFLHVEKARTYSK